MADMKCFLVQIVIVHFVHILRTTDSFHAGFQCSYSEIKRFLGNERNCPYLLSKLRNFCTKDVHVKNDTCTVFLNSDTKGEEITSAHVKFFSYGVRYKYDLKSRSCNHTESVKDVNVTLLCEHKTVIDGKMCINDDSCDRNKEICRPQDEIMENLCIQIQHLYKPCDRYSPCEKNTECKHASSISTCQCLEGYDVIDGRCLKGDLFLKDICNDDEQCTGTANTHCSNKGRNERSTCQCINGYIQINSSCFKGGLLLNETCNDDQQCTGTDNANCATNNGRTCQCIDGYIQLNSTCFKGNLHVYESCVWQEQCTGSTGANQCKYVEGFKMCYCSDGYGVFNGVCLKAGVSLGHACYLTEQCDGGLNSTECVPNKDGSMELSCQCNSGFIEINQTCLQADKGLYEECEVDDQCKGDFIYMVCKKIRHRKLCSCDAGFVEDRKSLKCLKASKEVNDSCEINEQCNGTKNAKTCHFEDSGIAGKCTCNQGFNWIDGRCLKMEKLIFEPCDHQNQCNGTKNANACKTFGNQRLCYCDQGYLEFKGNCIKDNKTLGESCEADIQCSGTEFGKICGNNGTCSCSKGFIRLHQKCLPVGRQIFEACDHPDQCNGTDNAHLCSDYGNKRLCYCNLGYLEFRGECIQVDKQLGESCNKDFQCRGSEHNLVCGENLTCSCNKGFIRINKTCLQDDESAPWINDKDNQFLLIVGAGCFGTIVFFISTLFLALNRNKSRKIRLNCQSSRNEHMRNNQNPMAENSRVINTATRRLICSEYAYSDPVEDNYRDTRQEETENENRNAYSNAQHQCSYRAQDSENGLYSYNHLHKERQVMLDGLYDSSTAISLSTFTEDK